MIDEINSFHIRLSESFQPRLREKREGSQNSGKIKHVRNQYMYQELEIWSGLCGLLKRIIPSFQTCMICYGRLDPKQKLEGSDKM
jgi:hypothetical protein